MYMDLALTLDACCRPSGSQRASVGVFTTIKLLSRHLYAERIVFLLCFHLFPPDHPIDPEYSIVGYDMGWFRSSYHGRHGVMVGCPGLSCPWLVALPVVFCARSFLSSDEIGVTLFANGESDAEPVM